MADKNHFSSKYMRALYSSRQNFLWFLVCTFLPLQSVALLGQISSSWELSAGISDWEDCDTILGYFRPQKNSCMLFKTYCLLHGWFGFVTYHVHPPHFSIDGSITERKRNCNKPEGNLKNMGREFVCKQYSHWDKTSDYHQ